MVRRQTAIGFLRQAQDRRLEPGAWSACSALGARRKIVISF